MPPSWRLTTCSNDIQRKSLARHRSIDDHRNTNLLVSPGKNNGISLQTSLLCKKVSCCPVHTYLGSAPQNHTHQTFSPSSSRNCKIVGEVKTAYCLSLFNLQHIIITTMTAVVDALAQWDALAQREVADGYRVKPSVATSSAASLGLNLPLTGLNATTGCPLAWREKIVEWCYQVVDHCELGRDVVSYAMSYFDRIVPHYGINDTLVQLVAMTCLYLAIKVHCSKKISVQSMVSLSRGSFRDDQVLKMERIVLQGLNWYLTPATPHLFLEIFFETTQDNEAMNEIKDSASYLLELAVCDNFFITKKASSISRAAILAAMDIVARPLEVNVLLENLLVDDDRCVVEKCYTRLLQIYNMIVKQDADCVPQEVIAEREVSPTSVFSVA
ncbi:cyclin family protein [Skeletonema marinoi]|uniref:Cyclin family protein n=1 Tax=Skeletonema marinoi TaxID=267567 RepID=A0AAD8Y1U1_9STRA|nr:cyclin family protein [Skeletonema marinoi]